MAQYGKTIHVRLEEELERKLKAVHEGHFAGLSRTAVFKFLVLHMLSKPTETLVSWIADEIKKPGNAPLKSTPKNRLHLNARRRPR